MEYKTKTNLILPFKGIWLVSNGGRTKETNSHNRTPDMGPQNQLYAYDFRMENSEKEKILTDYLVFGKEVLAPGSGVVIQVIDGSIDIEIGERDRSVGVGNAVIIDHQNGEYSLLCHFKHNSIKVRVGDKLGQGDVLGLCGNTGNTTQPHIHFNLQDGPYMHKSQALPAQFAKIIVDGQGKTCFEPIRGQHVSNPTV
ncbi:M23 family metallopeptidase [Candidatus Roizmanbacteria bacterium]|nr:M23 family metallopeptidase [Candidatus Roizmanbacteria bacterium]